MPSKKRFRLYRQKHSWKKKQTKKETSLRISLPISIYHEQEIQTVEELRQRMRVCGLPAGWTEQDHHQHHLFIAKIIKAANAENYIALVTIDESMNLQIHINGQTLNLDEHHMISAKRIVSLKYLYNTLTYIGRCNICKGNKVADFKHVITTDNMINNQKCLILCDRNHSRCQTCMQVRSTLTVRKARLKENSSVNNKTDPKSTHRYSLLSKAEMMEQMKIMDTEMVKIKKQRDRLREKVNFLLETQSTITLDSSDRKDMLQMMSENTDTVTTQQNTTPFQRLFWEQQLEAAKKGKMQGMRWHPLVIRWCIYLRHLSQKGYETMRESGIFLPSQRTLRDYTHHIKAKPGFSGEVDAQLCHAVRIDECEEWQKHVVLLLDEMHIKEGLAFDKHTG